MTRAVDDSVEVPPRTDVACSAAGFSIRPARPEDAELLVNLVHELAVYEKLEQHARATPDDFRRHLFGPRPAAEAAVAEVDGEPVGFALWFTHVLDLPRPAGLVPRRRLREAELPGPGDRQGAAGLRGPAGRRARVRAAGVVGAELERARDRLLPRPGRPADGRVDGLPDRRRAAPPAGRERRKNLRLLDN